MEKKEKIETKKKFDLKKEAKKAWDAFVRFVKPFSNLDKEVLMPKTKGFLQKNVLIIYYVGCAILALFAVFALGRFPYLMSILGQWIGIIVVFVLFRLLCEMIANEPKSKK